MKKILSAFLAFVLIFSAFSLNAFAAETTKAEDWIKENFTTYELGAKVTINDETTQTFYIKDKMIAGNIPYSENFSIDMILKNDCIYLYFKVFPYFHLKLEDIEIDYPIFEGIEPPEAFYDGNFYAVLDSKEYYVEEYSTTDGSAIRYYFLGDELKYIEEETCRDGYYNHTMIEILTTNVDDKVFNLPFFSINLTPVFKFLFPWF